MTTYSYTFTVNDTDMIALSEAVRHYIAYCDIQIANGKIPPYSSHKQTLTRFMDQRYSQAKLTSYSNFSDPNITE